MVRLIVPNINGATYCPCKRSRKRVHNSTWYGPKDGKRADYLYSFQTSASTIAPGMDLKMEKRADYLYSFKTVPVKVLKTS